MQISSFTNIIKHLKMIQLKGVFFQLILILILCICVYSQTLYAQTYSITIETNFTNSTNISYDSNTQIEANETFIISQLSLDVAASMNPNIIQNSTSSAALTLTFNTDMDQTSIPKVVFDPDVKNTLIPIANSAKWIDKKTYCIEYDVDNTNKVEINDIDVTVSDVKNDKGEDITPVKIADVFSINFLAPSCTVTFNPLIIIDGITKFHITLLYDTEMDITSEPLITFGNIIVYEQTFTNKQYKWESDKKTCIISYDIIDMNVQNPGILLIASNAKSSTGNEQVKCEAATLLIVDMLDFIVDVNANSSAIDCNSPLLKITVKFNQPMEESINNIVSFPNFDPKGFLTFSKMEWTANNVAVVEYIVHPDVAADQLSIDIDVSPVNNFLGREYSGETFTGKFSVKSTPPIIDNSIIQSPLCNDVENGMINLTVSGGISPFTYTWSKNDSPYTSAVGANNVTNLGAGQYDVIIKGADNCLATFNTILINPEAIVLSAEVKHHLVKLLDGEISLSVAGGTLPYTFYVNDANEGSKTEFTGLDAGIYNFEVKDFNNCTAEASTEIKNYQTPTIFTPNGDGFNDIFMEGNSIEIFDRNGTLVHKGNNGWDGRYKGQTVRPAIYFYIVTFPDGLKNKGSIQVYK